MLTKDEQLAVLEQLTYSDSRKVKEARRGKKYVISKALFLQSFYGKNVKLKRQLVNDFFTKVKTMAERTKIQNMIALRGEGKNLMYLQGGNKMANVKIAPINPNLIK